MTDLMSTVLSTSGTVFRRTGLLRPLSVLAGYLDLGRAFPILCYHRVNDEQDPFFPSLATEVFAEHMEFVAGAYVVLPVDELAERARRGTLPHNSLAITFDDGYRDNLTHAAPILARHGLAATVFLATGAIGSGEPLWFDPLALAFKHTRVEEWRAPWGDVLSLGSVAARLAGLKTVLDHLKRVPDGERRRMLPGVVDSLGLSGLEALKGLMMTWEDVGALVGLGIRIGAHTITHPILSRMEPAAAAAEIRGSAAAIAAGAGSRPRAFAYPNGREDDYSHAVVRAVREAGFTCAVTTRFGVNTKGTPPYELRRGTPWETDVPTFALRLAGYRLAHA
ncbi:MAG TPA: polysaccharide deacetylase family protein [Methylomirabilota bacterium]|nr:polysaccharide deacetylase family protein [Methylomirabilota bacterium]